MNDERPERDYGEGKTFEQETQGSMVVAAVVLAALFVFVLCVVVAARLIF